MVNKTCLGLILVLIFTACANKEASKTINIMLKSEQMKFQGQAFINEYKGNLKVDLYTLGKWVDSIKINDKICISKKCYKKSAFNEHFFGKIYYDNLLKDIFLCRPIFSKKNYKATSDGFEQYINNVEYKVQDNICTFLLNNIKIKITK